MRKLIDTDPVRSYVLNDRFVEFPIRQLDINVIDGMVLIEGVHDFPGTAVDGELVGRLRITAEAMDELCKWWVESKQRNESKEWWPTSTPYND